MMNRFDPAKIREDFPVLKKPLVYLDSACMSLKPRPVIAKMDEYYIEYTACLGRSAHQLANRCETEVAEARRAVARHIRARKDHEIIFTRNTTESINLIAHSFGLGKGDEVIVSDKEHNSNLIPWLRMRDKGIKVVVVGSRPDNTFDLDAFSRAFSPATKLVSLVHISNLDGVTNPIRDIARITHEHGALLSVDGAQSVPHHAVDVRALDIDFLSFSGHKMLGPTGTGVLYGKMPLLEELDQFIVGGETVVDATYDGYTKEHVPNRFEAGLQDYAGIIGLGEACRYLQRVGFERIGRHETELNRIITEGLDDDRIQLIGPRDPALRSSIFSFNIRNMDPHHVAKILDASRSILVRSGAHCVHSWFNKHSLKGSVRASLYLYNTESEAQLFVDTVKKIAAF
jgi:cysteine desulfurase / selenocysteine lyase